MIQSFKSLELSIYRSTTSLDDKFKYYVNNNDSNAIQLAATVFSTSFSLFTTYILNNSIEIDSLLVSAFIIIAIYVLGFLIAYFLFYKIGMYHKRKKYSRYHNNEYRNIYSHIKNFDCITCDNILIIYDLKDNYYKQSQNIEYKTFCYYEVLYYQINSIKYIKSILNNHLQCLNTSSRADAVDLFRVKNLVNMLLETQVFVDTEGQNISINDELKDCLSRKIENGKRELIEINEQTNNLIKEQNQIINGC